MSLTTRVLLGLVLGFAAGLAIAASGSPALAALAGPAATIGTLWVNALRMTVIPLVVASLVVGVAGAPDARSVARVGWRALVVFVLVLVAAGVFAVAVGGAMLGAMPVRPGAAAALLAATGTTTPAPAAPLPTFSAWLVSLVPVNPVQAAAEGAMLPLIIFTVAASVALLHLRAERRAAVTGFFHGLYEAMLVLVRWVLELAPLGVFALALPLAMRLGLGAAGALAYYVGVVAVVSVLFAALVLYPAAVIGGRVRPGDFARASAPAQAVAFSSRSSLASLPAMIEGATTRLRLSTEVTSFLLPLAASVFRAGAGIGITLGVLFVARLYGVALGPAQLATIVLTVVLTSFSIPGIPNGSILVMVPVMLAARIPVEGVGLLLAIDTVPDMFRTTVNVTGDMTAAAIVGRGMPRGHGAVDAPLSHGDDVLAPAREGTARA